MTLKPPVDIGSSLEVVRNKIRSRQPAVFTCVERHDEFSYPTIVAPATRKVLGCLKFRTNQPSGSIG